MSSIVDRDIGNNQQYSSIQCVYRDIVCVREREREREREGQERGFQTDKQQVGFTVLF